jgi:hypothetical protein
MVVSYHLAIPNYNNMDLRIFMEWDRECGLSLDKMYPIREGIEESFREKYYGMSIKEIIILLTCRPYDFKQRKRYKREKAYFEYDILIDFFLIKNVELEEKKKLIRYQMIEITEEMLNKFKFEDFDKSAFLRDFKQIVNSVKW